MFLPKFSYLCIMTNRETLLSKLKPSDVFSYDPESGLLSWRDDVPEWYFPTRRGYAVWATRHKGKPVGTATNNGYMRVWFNGKLHLAHRIIWHMNNGPIPDGMVIDHVNGNRADNRLENLRLCSRAENTVNRPMQSNNTSGYRGVSFYRNTGKWSAQIKKGSRNIRIGYFDTPEEAAEAYMAKAMELHGEFMRKAD